MIKAKCVIRREGIAREEDQAKMNTQEMVQKLWNLCHVLRDDGITYHQYVSELTYLLFIKMVKETGREELLPEELRWDSLIQKQGYELYDHYKRLLRELGTGGEGFISRIYANAATSIRHPQNLEKTIRSIDALDWYSARAEGFGDLYEGILAKNAGEKKAGAGQYFTPRPLVNVMVRLADPQLGERCCDPAAGTFGFMVAADRHIRQKNADSNSLSMEQERFQREQALSGCELVPDTHRLAMMNALLHGIEGEILLGDSLSEPGETMGQMDVILTNPPFGTKKGGERPVRSDLPFPTASKQLAFVQHIYGALKADGKARAAVVLPDNVLFQDGDGQKVRSDLMEKCNLHTILRLPTGIFYAPGVKTNVLFFTKGKDDSGNTREVWFYDLRSNMPAFGKRTPLTEAYFDGFAAAYSAADRRSVEDARWRSYTREEIARQGDNLDLGLRSGELELSRERTVDPIKAAEDAIGKLQHAVHLLAEVTRELRT